MDRLQVDVEVRGLIIQAYLTDEGLVVDVIENDSDGESHVIESAYEFFSEAGVEPPQPIRVNHNCVLYCSS
jgi:hypothetical protein